MIVNEKRYYYNGKEVRFIDSRGSLFLSFKNIFFKNNFFYFKVLFMFLDCFNALISKIIFKKYKKYYFNIFINKIYF